MNTDAGAGTSPDNLPQDEQLRWYVLKVQSNREKSIRDNILRRVRREGLERFFAEIIIPTEKVAETKGGKKRVTERKLYPGYIMVKMILNDESWFLIRETSGVGAFTGPAGKPIHKETIVRPTAAHVDRLWSGTNKDHRVNNAGCRELGKCCGHIPWTDSVLAQCPM